MLQPPSSPGTALPLWPLLAGAELSSSVTSQFQGNGETLFVTSLFSSLCRKLHTRKLCSFLLWLSTVIHLVLDPLSLISSGMLFRGSSTRGSGNHLPEILDKSVAELGVQPRAGVGDARPGSALPALDSTPVAPWTLGTQGLLR